MKKMLALLVLGGLMVGGCVKPYIQETEGTPLSNYSSIKVSVDSKAFLKTKEGDAHYDGYAKSCEDMNNVITSSVNSWLAANFHGKEGAPAANLVITVEDFYTGSGAARFFLGAAANGHLNVTATITGGHAYRVNAEIAGVGTDKYFAYKRVASATNNYINDHL
jgi:hypothetical protein